MRIRKRSSRALPSASALNIRTGAATDKPSNVNTATGTQTTMKSRKYIHIWGFTVEVDDVIERIRSAPG